MDALTPCSHQGCTVMLPDLGAAKQFCPSHADLTIRFKQWTCTLAIGRYDNGRVALVLDDAEDGQRVAKATVNVPEAELGADEILVKDWEENAGMLAALVGAGVVADTGRRVPAGHVEACVCRLVIGTDDDELEGCPNPACDLLNHDNGEPCPFKAG